MTNSTEPAWAVDTQRETSAINASGKLVYGVEIAFHTRAGHNGTVFVLDTDYRDLAVTKAIVGEAAARMDAAGALHADTETG